MQPYYMPFFMQGAGTLASVALPPHSCTTRQSIFKKSQYPGEAGVCCMRRVRDDCITVAVEEMPEEGLEQPLRLDKLANEVQCRARILVASCTIIPCVSELP